MLEFITSVQKFGWIKSIAALLVYSVALGGIAHVVGYSQGVSSTNIQENETNVNLQASALSAFDYAKPPSASTCSEKDFETNRKNWVLTQYSGPDKEGFYCPSFMSGFPAPDMWHKELLPLGTESIRLTFEMKDANISNGNVPAFVFSLGDSPRILRFYIAEASPQIVGLEKIDLTAEDNVLVREEPSSLQDPIKDGTQTELTVRPLVLQGNNARFIFNVAYISDLTNDRTEDNFSYDVKLPFPQPDEASIKFGLGTFKGSCVKPIKYEICQ